MKLVAPTTVHRGRRPDRRVEDILAVRNEMTSTQNKNESGFRRRADLPRAAFTKHVEQSIPAVQRSRIGRRMAKAAFFIGRSSELIDGMGGSMY